MFPDKLPQEAFLAAEYSLWETPVWFPSPESTEQQMLSGTTTCIPGAPRGSLRCNSHFFGQWEEKGGKLANSQQTHPLDNLGVNDMTQ